MELNDLGGKMTTGELRKILLDNKSFTIPDIQRKYGLKYGEIRKCVQQLLDEGRIALQGGLNYCVQNWSKVAHRQSGNAEPQTESYDDMIARRRKELADRLARTSLFNDEYNEDKIDDIEDDKDNDVDNDYIENLMKEHRQRVEQRNETMSKVQTLAEATNCKLIDEIDYGYYMETAQTIIEKLSVFDIKLQIKAIQFGVDSTRYVFEYLSADRHILDLCRYDTLIQAYIGQGDVKISVPLGQNRVAVSVQHKSVFDPLSKKALVFWLEHNGGKASIASIQRNLGVGFNRAGRIVDELQKLNCIDSLFAKDPLSKPLRVKLTLQEVDILFPQSLGWEC